MPAGKSDHRLATALHKVSRDMGWSAARLARELKLERTLVWRAMNGKPITVGNAQRIAIGLKRVSIASGPIDVSYAANLLRIMLRAVEAFEGADLARVQSRRET